MSVTDYVSTEIKMIAVKHSLTGVEESLNQTAAKFGVHRSTLQKWLLNYKMFGQRVCAIEWETIATLRKSNTR